MKNELPSIVDLAVIHGGAGYGSARADLAGRKGLQETTRDSQTLRCENPRRTPWVPFPLRRSDGGIGFVPMFPCVPKRK